MDTKTKINSLTKMIKDMKRVAVAFSGGIDSTFLAKICSDTLKENSIAITVNTPLQPREEIVEARRLANEIGIELIMIDIDMNDLRDIQSNDNQRCYKCKNVIFNRIIEEAKSRGYDYIVDGSNSDDTSDYRPGMRALRELGVISPLLENGICKDEIRGCSKDMGIDIWHKPSMSCLAARIPYGNVITVEKLEMVEKAEVCLKRLGFSQYRVRHHDAVARIEVPREEIIKMIDENISNVITKELKELGFKYISIDIEGYKTGSMNREIKR